MRVVIAGGGSVGRFIAEQLHGADHEVTIVDNDRGVIAQARRSGEPVGVTWFDGDACELGTLAAAEVDRADVVAAVTGDDEDNLVVQEGDVIYAAVSGDHISEFDEYLQAGTQGAGH